MKHTKGPWYPIISSDKRRSWYIRRTPHVVPGQLAVAQVFTSDLKLGEAEANMYLIAAAPELLSALKVTLTRLLEYEDGGATAQQARNAISLAELGKIRGVK